MADHLRRKVAVGVAWMTSARALVRLLGLLSTLVLARLLTPADFGIVAMAMAVAAALELLTLYSFETALIQQPDILRAHYDSAWTLNVLLGLCLAIALAAAAGPAAAFYREPRLEAVMVLVGAKFLIDGTVNTGTIDFRRQLVFGRDFVLQVGPKIAGILITIPLAYWLRDYRALLAGMLCSSVARSLLSYVMHPHRPRFCLTEARGLFRYSRWLLLNSVVGFLRVRSADFIIGRQLGAGTLGVFTVSYEVSNLPSTEMVAPINRVLFPSYVQLANDTDGLRESFSSTLGLIALVILPASIGLAAVADPLVRVVLGNQWLQTIPVISLLALAGAANVLQTNTGSVYNALGRPRLSALTGAIHAALLIPMLLYATHVFGLIGVAWAILIHSLALGMPITYWIFFRNTPIRPVDVWRVCWRPVVACVVMFIAANRCLVLLEPQSELARIALNLIAACFAGALAYVLTILVLWQATGRPVGAELMLLQKLGSGWRRHSSNDQHTN